MTQRRARRQGSGDAEIYPCFSEKKDLTKGEAFCSIPRVLGVQNSLSKHPRAAPDASGSE